MTGSDPAPFTDERAELDRIRSVFAERDRRSAHRTWIVEAYRRINEDRIERTHRLVSRLVPGATPSILDVGCGTGFDLAYWRQAGWPAECLAGVDLVPERIDLARDRCPGVDVRVVGDTALPFEDRRFDVTTAATVFSSILDPAVRRRLFSEMWRVTRPGGVVLVYDFVIRNPRNPHVQPLPSSALRAIAGPPSGSMRLTPILQVVGLASFVGRRFGDLAMRVVPRTHRLTWWCVDGTSRPRVWSGR